MSFQYLLLSLVDSLFMTAGRNALADEACRRFRMVAIKCGISSR